jgi:hypothetical protein
VPDRAEERVTGSAMIRIETNPDIGRGYWWSVTVPQPDLTFPDRRNGYTFTRWGAKRRAERAARTMLKRGSRSHYEYEYPAPPASDVTAGWGDLDERGKW